jgi:citrate synthase
MSEDNILFCITRDQLETGLRNVPIGYCTTSAVDPLLGLSYGGYLIGDLAERTPEEVIYLLLNSELPNASQLAGFKKTLIQHSSVDRSVIEGLKVLPKKGHPMKWFLAGLNLLGMAHQSESYSDAAIQVIAQMPEIVAAIFRLREGWGEPIPSKPELGYMENFAHMLGAPEATPNLTRILQTFNVLHMDHGGGNLSTFVGKAVASGHADMYESLVGAMAGLSGPLHGLANQACIEFLKEMLKKVGDPKNETAIADYMRELFERGEKIYGFGHAVLKVEDPRATVLYELGKETVAEDPLFQMALTVRKVGSAYLKTKAKVSNPFPNVDGVSGTLLNACGLKDSSYYTVLFGLARCVGIAAQIVYERERARGGKGTPIIRPKYFYTGPVREKNCFSSTKAVG